MTSSDNSWINDPGWTKIKARQAARKYCKCKCKDSEISMGCEWRGYQLLEEEQKAIVKAEREAKNAEKRKAKTEHLNDLEERASERLRSKKARQ